MIKKLILCSTLVALAMAETPDETVKRVMPGTMVEKAFATEIPELVGAKLPSGTIIYIHKPTELLFIGEIITKTGASLTALHKLKGGPIVNDPKKAQYVADDGKAQEAQEGLNAIREVGDILKNTVNFNTNKKNKYGYIVFTDPDCPYCKETDRVLKENNAHVEHYYIPLTTLHPNAYNKAVDIIADKKKLSKEKATEFLNKAQNDAKSLEIMGTPQLIVYEQKTNKVIAIIKGFNKPAIENYLENKKEKK